MREREEKRVAGADAAVLLERISKKGDSISFKEAVEILNDISYLVVSVDQGQPEFKQLILRIKSMIRSNVSLAAKNNFDLIEALCRMRIDSMSPLMRELIQKKQLSRSAKDLSVQMLYFASLLKNHN